MERVKKLWWLWVAVALIAGLGWKRLKLDVEILNLLPSDMKVVDGLKLYQKYFSNSRELIIAVSGPDAEAVTETGGEVASILRKRVDLVSDVVTQPPWMEHPEQLGELLGYIWLNAAPEAVRALASGLAPGHVQERVRETRENLATSFSPMELARLSRDPLGLTQFPPGVAAMQSSFGSQDAFASSDGTFRLLFVHAKPDLTDYRRAQQWIAAVKAAVKEGHGAGSFPKETSVRYSGTPAFVAEISSGMEHDTTFSVIGTAGIISILFWLAHRRLKPMLWLMVLLGIILFLTLMTGGLIFGKVNVISLGFAAILLGLAVDYAVVHYQEALAHPSLSIPQIRRVIAPSILWAAITTISAFLVLNLSGLPGLAQLGSLVACGVAFSALVMIFFFLPPLFPKRWTPGGKDQNHGETEKQSHVFAGKTTEGGGTEGKSRGFTGRFALVFLAVVALFDVIVLSQGLPHLDHSAGALRPRHSDAYDVLDLMKQKLLNQGEPVWVVVRGASDDELLERMRHFQQACEKGVSDGRLKGFTLPTYLLPNRANQSANRTPLIELSRRTDELERVALEEGFSTNALIFTRGILKEWDRPADQQVPLPGNANSRWIVEKFLAQGGGATYALGLIDSKMPARELVQWARDVSTEGVWVSGWELLGEEILERVKARFIEVASAMVALVLLALWFAFRRSREMVLSIGALGFSFVTLMALMKIFGWSWNLMNMMSVPLLLGTGVDYGIFIQQALRRHDGDLEMVHRSVGRALLLCGATAVAGFGSLGMSMNAGMSSLGRVCALGIGLNMLLAVYCLPTIWKGIHRRERHNNQGGGR